ncbi:MAG: CCA tRNA nucleotidyltransferase [Rhodospirillaceae bacterium]|nr:CCA tRNA nucleotidyltransferase [Rhodospirillaceae bacterium]
MVRLKPPWLEDPAVKRLMTALGAPALDVRFVGGCVRDAVLARPNADIDIGTPEPPARVMARLAAAGIKAIPTGVEHGTVTAVVDGRSFEVTTLRRDTATDGRHATVAFTTDWRADASRRDFTFNAMSLSADGTLHDYFKGASDARVGRLRFVGDPNARIVEDYLRILRLFRFYAWYGDKPIAPAILDAVRAHRDRLQDLSAERIRAELVKLLSAPNPVPAVAAMQSAGVLSVLFPGADGPNLLLKLVLVERAYRVAPRWTVRFCALAPDGAASTELAERFRLSGTERDAIVALRATEPALDAGMAIVALHAALYRHGAELIEGRAALAAARGRRLAGWADVFGTIHGWQPRPLPIGGDDVLALGVPPGPKVGALLAVAETAWIGSGFAAGRDDLLAAVRAKL